MIRMSAVRGYNPSHMPALKGIPNLVYNPKFTRYLGRTNKQTSRLGLARGAGCASIIAGKSSSA
ncbi:hypothetical protein Pma05_19770 [Plantactinospora mayteni]|uniref:Uncharacterized protein n=1 Tax=Plantactinospora mayteni TaxID=566021 RepID=A0ABQ4ELB3_9ACTN|nr:hypothetical protein Pma05_19770 [Plantactinospora mayteni]